jgi:hypothetical protein
MHVIASASIVEVKHLIDKLHPSACHLHYREEHRLISRSHEDLTLVIPEILLFYPEEQGSHEWSHMAEPLRQFPVVPVLLWVLGIRLGVALCSCACLAIQVNVIGVDHTWILTLVDCIEDAEDLIADKLVIPIDEDSDLVVLAVGVHGMGGAWEWALPLRPYLDCVSLGVDLPPAQLSLYEHSRVVIRAVILECDEVVGVVLVEYGLDVEEIPVLGCVVAGRHHYANRHLLRVLTELVPLLISL